jgi:cell division transport system permease protein
MWWLGAAVSEVAGVYGSRFNLIGLTLSEFAILVALATGLGFVGSYLSVNRYIKEIEPDKVYQ